MNSFGRQEGGGFRRREGKLVSPVRRDYPLPLQTDRNEEEGVSIHALLAECDMQSRGGIEVNLVSIHALLAECD